MEGAAYLMDRPRGGWDSLATKDGVATKDDLERLEPRIRTELHAEIRAQTRWVATLVIATFGVVVASTAGIGAALRFA